MIFKNIDSDDILISPFEVHKTFTVTNNDSGSGVYSIPITKELILVYIIGVLHQILKLYLQIFLRDT